MRTVDSTFCAGLLCCAVISHVNFKASKIDPSFLGKYFVELFAACIERATFFFETELFVINDCATMTVIHSTVEEVVDKNLGLDSACFLRMWSPKRFFAGGGGVEEFVFFLIFFRIWNSWLLKFLLQTSWRIRFADTTALSFFMVKSSFLHLVLLGVCKI